MLADEGEDRDQNGQHGDGGQRDTAGAGGIGAHRRQPRPPALRTAVGYPGRHGGVEIVVGLVEIRTAVTLGVRPGARPEAAVKTGQALIIRHAAER